MPAILRIFVYQTDASLTVLGQCGSYDQVGGHGGGRWQSMICLQHYAIPAVAYDSGLAHAVVW